MNESPLLKCPIRVLCDCGRGHKNNYFLGKDQRKNDFQDLWFGADIFKSLLIVLKGRGKVDTLFGEENADAQKRKVNCIAGLDHFLYPFLTSLQFYGWILCQPLSVRGQNFNDKNVGTASRSNLYVF